MKKHFYINGLVLLMLLVSCKSSPAQNPENWTKSQLIEPATLARIIAADKDLPIIISVGPGAVIPHSIDIGMVKDEENMTKFKEQVGKLPKSANIVLYCGCCPFDHCPNVRPAIAFLKSQDFINYHLLNLPHNLKTDWLAKGYPSVN